MRKKPENICYKISASLLAKRNMYMAKAQGYGLLYEAMAWTKAPVTEAMLPVFDKCVSEVMAARDPDAVDLWSIRRRLVAVGFEIERADDEESTERDLAEIDRKRGGG